MNKQSKFLNWLREVAYGELVIVGAWWLISYTWYWVDHTFYAPVEDYVYWMFTLPIALIAAFFYPLWIFPMKKK